MDSDQAQQSIPELPPAVAQSWASRPEVLVAIALVAATLLYFVVASLLGGGSKGSSRKTVLVGPCNAGKTCLFYQLAGGSPPEGTVASMQENEGSCQVLNDKGRPSGSVRLVDVPGHERLRHKLDQHLKDAKAVIFVLDAVDITPHKMETAEELFEVLTHPSIARRRVPILLACNKMDLEAEAHSVDFIRRTVEKQLDLMRKTRTALSQEAAAKAAVLGKPAAAGAKPLSLSGLRNAVTLLPVSALTGDVAGVHAFLLANVR